MIRTAKFLLTAIIVFTFSFLFFLPRQSYAIAPNCFVSMDSTSLSVGTTYDVRVNLVGIDQSQIQDRMWQLYETFETQTVPKFITVIDGKNVSGTSMVFKYTPTTPGDKFFLDISPNNHDFAGGQFSGCEFPTDPQTLTITGSGLPTATLAPTAAPTPGGVCYKVTNDSAAGWSCSETQCTGDWANEFRFDQYDACQARLAAEHPTPTGPPGADLITPFPTQVAAPPPPCADYDLVKGRCKKTDTALGLICTEAGCFIQSLFAILLSLSGGSAILVMIYAGYLFMTSRGNPEGIQKAREIIISAIIGLLFIVFSYAIMEAITGDLLHLPGFDVYNQCNDRNHQC